MKTARRRASNRPVSVHTARKVICKYEGPPAPPIKPLDTIDRKFQNNVFTEILNVEQPSRFEWF
jgi:hypothetical protein